MPRPWPHAGRIDILVNNSGTSNAKPFLDIDDDDWQDDFDLKLFSAVRLCRLCLPHMRDQGWGRIINSLNIGAKAASAQTCPTAATRAAGLAMTKALASEFAADGVLVNALITGLLVTHQWRTRWEREGTGTTFTEFTAAVGDRIPAGRMGDAQEFANLALFLAERCRQLRHRHRHQHRRRAVPRRLSATRPQPAVATGHCGGCPPSSSRAPALRACPSGRGVGGEACRRCRRSPRPGWLPPAPCHRPPG